MYANTYLTTLVASHASGAVNSPGRIGTTKTISKRGEPLQVGDLIEEVIKAGPHPICNNTYRVDQVLESIKTVGVSDIESLTFKRKDDPEDSCPSRWAWTKAFVNGIHMMTVYEGSGDVKYKEPSVRWYHDALLNDAYMYVYNKIVEQL